MLKKAGGGGGGQKGTGEGRKASSRKKWREFKRNNSRRRVGKGEDTEAAVLEEE